METEIEKGIGKGIGGEGISRAPSTSASETVDGEQQNRQEQGQSQDGDANLVWWDGEDDAENPMNWSTKKKWSNLGLMSCVTFIT